MNEMKWVPGFIWVTPRGQVVQRNADGRNECHYEVGSPMLVAINQMTDLRPHKHTHDRQDIANTRISVCGNRVSVCGTDETFVDVIETVEEIAELIRQEWEGRISLQAEIRRAVESGEAE